MQNMKKNQEKQVLINEDSKKKERHIVTWTQEEDDILRDQIDKHGTENWAIIASKFKDKTTRQCRRRWYTYLNSDFKKGGWSPEEDMLLCEAQKIFGNRWTEIAKVVSGRTDNAVKNRFATLCKKRAKCEALAKENNTSYINSNNKRVILHEYNTYPVSKPDVANKMGRSHVPDDGAENISFGDRSHKQIGTPIHQQGRAPFAVLHQNSHNVNKSEDQHHVCNAKFSSYAQNNKMQGTFLKNDDSKINLLMQQAELLSSLALKVDAKNMDLSLENTWKVLQDFMNQTKESDIPRYKIPDLQLVDLKDLLEYLKSSREGIQPCWRQMELYEDCLGSSEHSTESTFLPNSCCENLEHSIHQDIEPKSIQIGDQGRVRGCDQGILSSATSNQVADIFPSCKEQINNDGIVSALSSAEFSSPLQVTPLFRSLTAGIPSPHFSESERSFLMKTLGMESPSLNLNANKTSQPPLCKRTLLHSLY